MDHSHHSTIVDFFHKMHDIVPVNHRINHSIPDRRKTSDGYATLVDFHNKPDKRNTRVPALMQAVYSPPMQPKRRESSNQSAHYSTITSSEVSPPHRRAAPLIPLRLPTLRARLSVTSPQLPAPLATPDPVDLQSPEFIQIQKKFSSNGESSNYHPVDFATPPSIEMQAAQNRMAAESKANESKQRALRSRIFSTTSGVSSFEPVSPASASDSTASRSSSGINYNNNQHRQFAESRSMPVSSAVSRPKPKSPTIFPSEYQHSSMSSSVSSTLSNSTSNSNSIQFNKENNGHVGHVSVIRRGTSMQPQTRAATTIITVDRVDDEPEGRQSKCQKRISRYRQSLSAESIADLVKKSDEKKKFPNGSSSGQRLVRRVATSFRFKKKNADQEDKQQGGSGTRSLPQTPATERKTRKLLNVGSSERLANALSWLPSRSPKKSKASSAELPNSPTPSHGSGSILCSKDTLESLTCGGQKLPSFLVKCIEYIEQEGGFETEGLYRVPGNQAQVAEVEKIFKKKGILDVENVQLPIHVVATAVKNLFSCLPEPLIPYTLHSAILDCLSEESKELMIERLSILLEDQLPPSNYIVLKYLMTHLNLSYFQAFIIRILRSKAGKYTILLLISSTMLFATLSSWKATLDKDKLRQMDSEEEKMLPPPMPDLTNKVPPIDRPSKRMSKERERQFEKNYADHLAAHIEEQKQQLDNLEMKQQQLQQAPQFEKILNSNQIVEPLGIRSNSNNEVQSSLSQKLQLQPSGVAFPLYRTEKASANLKAPESKQQI
ncbi:hypothetical protein WR25_10044 [Diploscapter pachys]|uniref:Rho-GAP domain-containing protein n=1 Tax=Diploscapter pachys TaxID=2018661 RepID=A0A2A2JAX0_9BILA|nr:hypothetical protein WR25_10044 [Diploscapter pachys]